MYEGTVMACRAKRVRSHECFVLSLCLFVFLFSWQAKLELYGHGLTDSVHPCNSSKLCLDAHAPKLVLSGAVLARIAVSSDHRPTLRSEPLVEQTFFVAAPRELSLPYQRRLHRSPPLS